MFPPSWVLVAICVEGVVKKIYQKVTNQGAAALRCVCVRIGSRN